jgi:hypothetical protein
MGLLDQIRTAGYVDDGSPPLVVPGKVTTLAAAADRVLEGVDRLHAARDFLDIAARRSDVELAALVADEPRAVDARSDALLAGIAEHLMASRGLAAPRWCEGAGRFLDTFWFVSENPAFRAIALASSPIAMKRRGVIWAARSMVRV